MDPLQIELAIMNLAVNGCGAMGGAGWLTPVYTLVEQHEYLRSPEGGVDMQPSTVAPG